MISDIKPELLALEDKLVDYLKTPNQTTNDILDHIFRSGGKRMRPALFLFSCRLLGYDGELKSPMAAVCEYIHTASLLHDDVIDNSALRRHKPTVNALWSNEAAVLCGDLIYSAACRLMVKTGNLDIIDCFAECIRAMSESELLQLDLLWKKETTIQDYERIVHGKTALLFEACCKTPAWLAHASPKVVDLLAQYGRCLGFIFQIIDDCLDYVSSSSECGKPVLSDLLEGKVTLPLIYACQENAQQLKAVIADVFQAGKAADEQKQYIVEMVKNQGGIQRAQEKAREYTVLAEHYLQQLKETGCLVTEQQYATLDDLVLMTKLALQRQT